MSVGRLLFDTLRFGDRPSPEALRDAWATADTRGVGELVASEGCELWLYRRLRQVGAIEDSADPESFAGSLSVSAKRVAGHNMRVDAQTEAVVALLAQGNVPHALLKGAALRAAADRYPLADARSTHDVDVLLPASLAESAWKRFRDAGYSPKPPPNFSAIHFHLCPLVDAGGVAVEIHTSTSRIIASEEAWRRAADEGAVTDVGSPSRIPSSTELLWHATCHALTHDALAFRLRYFLDAAAILAADPAIDWPRLVARAHPPEVDSVERLVAWLGAAAALAGTTLPGELARIARRFALVRALNWRLSVLRRWRADGTVGERLIEEGTRADVGMPLTPALEGASIMRRARRRVAALAGRSAYHAWRLTSAGATV